MKKVWLVVVAVVLVGSAAMLTHRVTRANRKSSAPRNDKAEVKSSGSAVSGATAPAADSAPIEISRRGPGLKPSSLESFHFPVPRTFDLAHVQPEYFAAALDKDPVRIFEFVRDQIRYEAYEGCLRGPRGTLLAMAGNSVDRAELLAAMLQASGNRVRYVRGTLSTNDARDLVTQMWAKPPESQPQSHPSPASKLALEKLIAGVKRDYQLLHDRLKSVNDNYPQPSTNLDSLLREAKSHYWIQWAKNTTWVDLDPSFSDSIPGYAYARAEESFDAIPDTLYHGVTIRIRLEEYTGSSPSTRDILSYTAKAADLSGVDIVVGHQPENWKGPAQSLRSALSSAIEETGRVKPILVIGPKDWIPGEPFRQRRPTGQGIGGIQGMLAGIGTRTAVPIATVEFIEFTFSAPDGHKDVVTRELFDVVGKAQRASGKNLSADEVYTRTEAGTALDVTSVNYDLFFTTGRLDSGYLVGLIQQRPKDETLVDLRAPMQRINLSLVALSDSLLSGSAKVVFYPDSPRVVITEISTHDKTGRLAIDLRRNSVRAVSLGAQPQQMFFDQVFRGVLDGTVERLVTELVTHQPGTENAPMAISASSIFERAYVAGAPIRLIKSQDMPVKGLPENTLARLREDLVQGYWAVAPERPINLGETPRFAWWRIDPHSGETVAIIDDGLHGGQGPTEYEFITDRASGNYPRVFLARTGTAGETAQIIKQFEGGVENLGRVIDFLMEQRGDFILHINPYW